jgi:hypothetical protein
MSNPGEGAILLRSPSSSFPQQGQVDWTTLSKNTVEFTVETLSRLSRAGIEALTIVAGTAVSRHARLDPLGEQRLQDALRRARVFSSIHIIRIYTLIKFGRVRSCVAGTLDMLAEMDQSVV